MRKRKWAYIPAFLAAVMVLLGCAFTSYAQEGTPQPELIEMEDGEYAIDVALEGGSGRAGVTSPAVLLVKEGYAYARIEWSSSHYDYMKVGDETYYPVNEEGNSVFEIPITVFGEPMPVIGDTTAMSVPHEVEYTLIFDIDSITDKGNTPQAAAQKVVYMAVAICIVCALVSVWNKKRRNSVR